MCLTKPLTKPASCEIQSQTKLMDRRQISSNTGKQLQIASFCVLQLMALWVLTCVTSSVRISGYFGNPGTRPVLTRVPVYK